MNTIDLPPISLKNRISPSEILLGNLVHPIDRLKIMSEEDFEALVHEWAYEYLSSIYVKVKKMGGAGDKGRDVVGFYEDGSIDIYQCKHYDDAITPFDIYIEIAKLCYYTYNNDYNIPRNYIIVSPKGIGPKLQDWLDSPEKLKSALIEKWEENCSRKITSKVEVLLEGDFFDFVNNFDYSIIKGKEPLELIEEHSKTKYHAMRFGGGLIKTRESIPKPSEKIEDRELNYVNQLFEVYSEEINKPISSKEELLRCDGELYQHFNLQRDSFYSAESLERFSRDNFPDSKPRPFDEIIDASENIVKNSLLLSRLLKGFDRLLNAIKDIQQQPFLNNALEKEISIFDKNGFCHHLANDNKVFWKHRKV